MGELTLFPLQEIAAGCLKIWGRTTGELSPLSLFWTGSGIELNVKGSELWLEVETDYDVHEQWASVLVNGAPVSRQMLSKGTSRICLFRGMNPENVKNVRFLKDLQAMSEDMSAALKIHAVLTDGTLLPVTDRPYKIEFIGDSITSGEGIIGAKEELDWIPMFFSAAGDYAHLVSEACNAECHIISQSGWGILTGWDNNPHSALPKYYTQVCGLLKGEKNHALGTDKPYDFAGWQPDVVVVNLGTNDGGAFEQPEYVDPESGEIFGQHKEADGSYRKEDTKRLSDAVEAFLRVLRKCNPHAHIVWAYGMLGTPMMPFIREGIFQYQKKENDSRVSFLLLPDTTDETVGSRSHPGYPSHKHASLVLADYIKALLGEGQA